MINVNEKKKFEDIRCDLEEKKIKLQNTHSAISTWRAVCFLLGLTLVIIGISDGIGVALAPGIILLVLFVVLVKRHGDIEQLIDETDSKFQVVDKYVKRFTDEWRQFPKDGSEFLGKEDYVSSDIDLLGANSLYQMINVCHTKEGAMKFAGELSGAYPDESCLASRQEAIKELVSHEEFAIDFEAAGIRLENTEKRLKNKQIDALDNSNEDFNVPNWFWTVRLLLPAIEITLIFLSAFGVISYGYPLAVFFIILMFTWFTKPVTDKYILSFYMIGAGASLYLEIFRIVKQAGFKSELLSEMSEKLGGDDGCIKAFTKLKSISQGYNISFNPLLHQLLSGIFLWDFQLACVVSRWRKKYGNNIVDGFNCIADIEELLSLSVLARVRRTDFAKIISSGSSKSYIKCDKIYHPLIKPECVVANSASLDGGITIITGSNMSGKTTFLRTIAINLVLAYLGAPVCGDSLEANVMRIFTSMRVTDDVANGISTFYAEILRIKSMASYREQNLPMLCLIDEIFKGTNSADRIVGAKEAITRLSGEQCITIVSTHDFELCDIKDQDGNPAVNYHFEEYYKDNELCFDYKIKDGICRTTNARAILKMAGFNMID